MLDYKYLNRIDLRVIILILILMSISLLVISSTTSDPLLDPFETPIFNRTVKSQIQWFVIGFGVFFFFASFDYNKLREWTWILYGLMILLLVGLFFTDPIQRVHRWYRIPLININFQPSEYAKLITVISLSWFLERQKHQASSLSTAFYASLIVGVPFLLILKQPDLGTALVLFPITLVMFYFGNIHSKVVRLMTVLGVLLLTLIAALFLEIIPHESIRPYATKVIKEYQFNRLDPNTHHKKAATTAIAFGGIVGSGWRKGEYIGGKWLPAPHTDSVFPAFGEEFGLIGMFFLLGIYYYLIYCCFQVTVVAKDSFGRLLAAGIAVYLAMHIIVNIGMMCGFFPITGVPLILITYGGSSVLATMTALGMLQSIYSRRFMF